MQYDAIIIGAGPAGILSAYHLKDKRVLVIEKGASLDTREELLRNTSAASSVDVEVEGVAGAGGWSDGKLCLGPVGIRDEYLGPNYEEETNHIDGIFRQILGSKYIAPNDQVGLSEITRGTTQEITKVANLGTSNVRLAFQRLVEQIQAAGVQLELNKSVKHISGRQGRFEVSTESGDNYIAKNIVIAAGKCDMQLTPGLIQSYGLSTLPTEPTIGFRIVVPASELSEMKKLGNNPKLKMQLANGDTVKTHCFAYAGEAMSYRCGNYRLVGGRADKDHPTEYATVAILYKLSADDPSLRKSKVKEILNSIARDYPGSLLYQDLSSFMADSGEPTIAALPLWPHSELGNLVPYFPEEMTDALRGFVNRLSDTYGMDLKRAAILGPAAEWISDAVKTSFNMESETPGLYFAGDGSGITQGIIASAVAGTRAANSILATL